MLRFMFIVLKFNEFIHITARTFYCRHSHMDVRKHMHTITHAHALTLCTHLYVYTTIQKFRITLWILRYRRKIEDCVSFLAHFGPDALSLI